MTQEDITRMAIEAGLLRSGEGWTEPHRWGMTELERFAALVADQEREACAKICKTLRVRGWSALKASFNWGCTACFKALKARGEK